MADESHPGTDADPGNLRPPRLLGGRRKAKAVKPAQPVEPFEPVEDAAPTEQVEPVEVEDPEPTAVWEPIEPVAAPEPDRPVADGEASSGGLATEVRPRRRTPRPGRVRLPGGVRRPGHVDGRVAAVVAGLVAGFVLVGGVVLGLQGCQAVQGTESCGTAPGMGLLVVIFVVAVLVGRFLLSLFRQPDPGSTSFLSVGLTSVLALLFLTSVIDSWPMIIVIPVLTAVTMLGSWLVTTRFVGSAGA